jgi:phage terminase large subunit-like protein
MFGIVVVSIEQQRKKWLAEVVEIVKNIFATNDE